MKIQRRAFLHLLAGVAAFQAVPRAALAQSYPAKPVRVIVPFAPAGPADVLARLIMSKLSQSLGQQFYIENQAGAGGNLGMGTAARAAPDGYTIAVVSTSFVVNPSLYPKIPYDPVQGFRAGHARGGLAQRAGGPSLDPGEQRQGVDRVPQGQSGQIQLRAFRSRNHAASVRRDVQTLARAWTSSLCRSTDRLRPFSRCSPVIRRSASR